MKTFQYNEALNTLKMMRTKYQIQSHRKFLCSISARRYSGVSVGGEETNTENISHVCD